MARPHAVMAPHPTPGHINPMLKLAKLLHFKGFFITFVITEYIHHCLLQSGCQEFLNLLDDFQFQIISDGLPLFGRSGMNHIKELIISMQKNYTASFRDLLIRLNSNSTMPPVNCVVAGFMSTPLKVVERLGIRTLLLWTMSACGCMGTLQIGELLKRGYIPLRDESCLTSGYLDTPIDWVPGMSGIRLRDLTCFIRTTNRDDVFLNFNQEEAEGALESWGVILNTFDDLEDNVLAAMRQMFPRLYTVGSLTTLANQIPQIPSKSISLSIWKEDAECLSWLESKKSGSVVYVNFGSITVLTAQELIDLAWGIADSKHPFLWIIRPDLLPGESSTLPREFIEETKSRSFITSWCQQDEVLAHPSIGGFFTHCGWNSMLESVCRGVPMLCWPFFAEQPTNCRYACREWGVGMEIEGDVKRGQVERLVRELMEGDEGKAMKENALKWKQRSEEAAMEGGSSYLNMERLVHDILE